MAGPVSKGCSCLRPPTIEWPGSSHKTPSIGGTSCGSLNWGRKRRLRRLALPFRLGCVWRRPDFAQAAGRPGSAAHQRARNIGGRRHCITEAPCICRVACLKPTRLHRRQGGCRLPFRPRAPLRNNWPFRNWCGARATSIGPKAHPHEAGALIPARLRHWQ